MKLNYKRIISWAVVLFIVFAVIFLIVRYFSGEKKLKVIWPQGEEKIMAGQTYSIRWDSKNIGKIGILLARGEDSSDTKWIARDVSARAGRYDWEVFVWEESGEDYKIVLIEYPWEEGKYTAYSKDFFSILGPQFASCDQISTEEEWFYISSDYPDLRRVFITYDLYQGNLGGLEGADQKCQEQAELRKMEGTWKAFLGNDTAFALDRLELDGIIVHAEPGGTLPQGKVCYRFLAKDFDTFYNKIFDSSSLAEARFSKKLYDNLAEIWLGRVDKNYPRNCLFIERSYKPYQYSFTVTCQNWTNNKITIEDYSPFSAEEGKFPICYDPDGNRVDAVGIAGISSSFVTEAGTKNISFDRAYYCGTSRRLLCIEQ